MQLLLLLVLIFVQTHGKSVTLSSPTESTIWRTGTPATVSWTSEDIPSGATFTLNIYNNGILSDNLYATITTNATGTSHSFQTPYKWESGDNYYVEITYNQDIDVSDWSDDFEIIQLERNLHVLRPTREAMYLIGSDVVITWASSEGIFSTDFLNIDLINRESVVSRIGANVPNTGSFVWKTTNSLNPSPYYHVNISTTDNVVRVSSPVFTLTNETQSKNVDLEGVAGHLILAYFSDETYSSGPMQPSYLWPYNGKCGTWNKEVEHRNEVYAKLAIYRSASMGALILTFKGSDSLNDFITNANAPFDPCAFGSKTCGQVHSGFLAYYAVVRETIFAALAQEEEREGEEMYDLYITGHSLGGALGMLAAIDIAMSYRSERMESISLVTFGQPRVGDDDFVSVFDSQNISYTRYVQMAGEDSDLVTLLPPSSIGYSHAGKATVLECPVCGGVGVGLQLHSINVYITEMQAESGTSSVCANRCSVMVSSDSIWQFSIIPDEDGCTVEDQSKLSVSVASSSNDRFAVCMMTTGEAHFYEYDHDVDCDDISGAVLSPRSNERFVTNTNVSAGTYVVVVENHNSVSWASMSYNVSFSQGTSAPSPPLLSAVTSASADGLAIRISWTPPDDVGVPEFTHYVLYWGIVGETWQDVNISSNLAFFSLGGLAPNSFYSFVMTATNGIESDISNEVYYDTTEKPLVPPNLPAFSTSSPSTTSPSSSSTRAATSSIAGTPGESNAAPLSMSSFLLLTVLFFHFCIIC